VSGAADGQNGHHLPVDFGRQGQLVGSCKPSAKLVVEGLPAWQDDVHRLRDKADITEVAI